MPVRTTRLVAALASCALLAQPAMGETTQTPAPIKLISPGTIIADEPPAPWTHLIVKSQPRVTAGDVAEVASSQIRFASLYFMATLARVEQDKATTTTTPPTYRLADLASGIGTNIGGRDVIVSPDTAKKLGADLGWIGGALLKEMYEEQQTVRVIARTAATAVWDTPIVLRLDGKNRSLQLRYAVVVDPQSGRLDAFAWLLDVESSGAGLELRDRLQWLAPNTQIDCRLFVDKSEYFLGIPSDEAFACLSIPRGQVQFNMNQPQIAALLTRRQYNKEETELLATTLRRLVQRGQAALQANQTRAK